MTHGVYNIELHLLMTVSMNSNLKLLKLELGIIKEIYKFEINEIKKFSYEDKRKFKNVLRTIFSFVNLRLCSQDFFSLILIDFVPTLWFMNLL